MENKEERLKDGKSRCTCGSNIRDEYDESHAKKDCSSSGSSVDHYGATRNLDISFVQIPSYFPIIVEEPDDLSQHQNIVLPNSLLSIERDGKEIPYYCSSFIRRLALLQQATEPETYPPSLCKVCLRRVEQALEASSSHLLLETQYYRQIMKQDISRLSSWKQAIVHSGISCDDVINLDHDGFNKSDGGNLEAYTLNAYRREIDALEESCRQHREELSRLLSIRKERTLKELQLDLIQDAIVEEQNSLELEARAFDNSQEQLSRKLALVHDEAERLSSCSVRLLSHLIHLHIDKDRGLRYPLINELRLAYRPKGDIHQKEIQVAWSLASHLLLVVANTFEFRSQQWKIVPLSHCAKLIYYPHTKNDETSLSGQAKNRSVVFNIGHPRTLSSKALLTWNALLSQVITHVKYKLKWAYEHGILESNDIALAPPYEISVTKIGNISLSQLDESNDGEWSRAIHYMASDLLWLSECSSTYALRQVMMKAAFPSTETTPAP
jgi:hypothetical protein